MLGFGFLRYGLEFKRLLILKVHLCILPLPAFPSSGGDIIGSCLEAPQRPWTCFDLSSRPHSQMHISHTFSYTKLCSLHNMDVQDSFLYRLPPSNHMTQSVTLQNAVISLWNTATANKPPRKPFNYPQRDCGCLQLVPKQVLMIEVYGHIQTPCSVLGAGVSQSDWL